MDVLVTWDDNTTNCVAVNELKPAERNKKIDLGSKVKMRYKSKWYFGTVTAVEDAETGEIKKNKPGDLPSEVSNSECSEDDVPLSTIKRNSGNEVDTEKKDDSICACLTQQSKKIESGERTVTAVEDAETGEIKKNKPGDLPSEVSNSECSEDDVPLSTIKRNSGNEVDTEKKDDSICACLTQQSKKIESGERTVTAVEDAETGEIKKNKPGDLPSEVSNSECSEDDVPLSTIKRNSGNEVDTEKKDDSICACLTQQSKKIESGEIMDVSSIDDPRYQPERSSPSTVPQQADEIIEMETPNKDVIIISNSCLTQSGGIMDVSSIDDQRDQPERSSPSTVPHEADEIIEMETSNKDVIISDCFTQSGGIMDVSSFDNQRDQPDRSSPPTIIILQQADVAFTANQIETMDIIFRDNLPCSVLDNVIEDVELGIFGIQSKPPDLPDDTDGVSKMDFESQMEIGSKNNSTTCSSNQSLSLLPIEDISDDNDPDYRPGKSTNFRDLQETTTAINLPMLRSCEVSCCLERIFDSCNKCFKFLCKEHIKEKVPCNNHGNNVVKDILEASSKTNVVLSQIRTDEPQTVSKKIKRKRRSYDDDQYVPQTCEVPHCSGEVFSSCFRCNILLCWPHFDTETSCELHKKKNHGKKITVTSVKILRPADNNESHQEKDIILRPADNNESHQKKDIIPSNPQLSNQPRPTVDIETEYAVDGSQREFNLPKKEKGDKRKLATKLRIAGQEYESYSSKKIIPAKTVGAYCNVANCQENGRDCYLFTDIDRKVIFAEYYNTGEIAMRRGFITRHVTEHTPKQRTVIAEGKESRRKRTLRYCLSCNGKKHPVCRTFFLNTLAISEKFVRTSLAMVNETGILMKDARGGRVESLKQTDDKINETIKKHINRFPRVESHYCREKSSKQYLHPTLHVKKMHRLLLDELNLPRKQAPSLSTYRKIFKTMNLSFMYPIKDQCSLCAAYHDENPENKLILKTRYDSHIDEKNTVRQLKKQDKTEASKENPEIVCACFDLQQVIYLPITNEGGIFYKRQLSVYNFTIYNIATRDCYCFIWPETESKRGSSEISTALSIFINEHDVAGTKSISLYADGCAGQNKNSITASALMHCINNTANLQTITLRFFAPSHGQNEGDSAHSAITYAYKKAGDIFLPAQLHPIIQMARPSHPYIVRPLQYSDFKNFKDLSQEIQMLKLRKDNETGAPINWTEVVEFKVDKENPTTLYFKTSHNDTYYRSITVRRLQAPIFKKPVGPLNLSQVKISKAKYQDLMSLCTGDTAIIRHSEYKDFYKNLPHEE